MLVTGATGKMGRRVLDLVHADTELTLVGAVTHAAHAAVGRDAGELAGLGPIGVPVEHTCVPRMPETDVIIDFSVPEAALEYARLAAVHQKAIVIGTTGFSTAQQEALRLLSQRMRCFLAPNMSVGVNVLFQALRQLVTSLGPGYDVEIMEAHHRTKVDAPSGTALRLASIVAAARGVQMDEVAVYGRHGLVGRRSDTEIGIQAMRAGDIVGEHTIFLAGTGERLELIHRSHSRDTFASGALRAAKWILKQPNGLYSMEELLSLA
ncbi:MAG: 4-hydroxy-tetrahydrodipicolinate reductase [Candidatus Tectimicrobiota bacterium]